jgi:hypothetical protein
MMLARIREKLSEWRAMRKQRQSERLEKDAGKQKLDVDSRLGGGGAG